MKTLILDNCHEWRGAKDAYGYGMRRFNGKVVRVHRIAFYMYNGFWPEVVQHDCDNPACYNVDHLTPGTRVSNNKDRDAKGRNDISGFRAQWEVNRRCER